MDITQLIERECPDLSSEHNISYRKELLNAFSLYRNMDLRELERVQKSIQETKPNSFGPTHNRVARLVVLKWMIDEIENDIIDEKLEDVPM